MTRTGTAALLSAVGAGAATVGAGAAAVRKVVARNGAASPAAGGRWHSVTVAVPPEQVDPEPLAPLGDTVEVRVEPAPGGHGTELHARLRAGRDATREQVEELFKDKKDGCVRSVLRPGE